jgi:hypothetical protein
LGIFKEEKGTPYHKSRKKIFTQHFTFSLDNFVFLNISQFFIAWEITVFAKNSSLEKMQKE